MFYIYIQTAALSPVDAKFILHTNKASGQLATVRSS